MAACLLAALLFLPFLCAGLEGRAVHEVGVVTLHKLLLFSHYERIGQ